MNKSEINKFYNFVKVITASELKQLVLTYHDNSETIIVMMHKKHTHSSKIDLLVKEFRCFRKEMTEFKQDINNKLDKIELRLDKIELRLDNHDKLFKQHEWIK